MTRIEQPAIQPIPPAACRYCTVPVESGDICTFCASYPTEDPIQRSCTAAVLLLAQSVRHARMTTEDIENALRVLPEDAPLFAVSDLVSARAHVMAARRLLDRSATAAGIGGAA